MVGAKLGAQRLAVRKSLLRGQLAVNATRGTQPVVFLYDPALDVGRAFLAAPHGAPLRFAPTATPGRYADEDTGSRPGTRSAGPCRAGEQAPACSG